MPINIHKINFQRLLNYILFGALIVVLGMHFENCERQQQIESNNEVLKSQISVYKLKNGQLVASQKALIATSKEDAITLIGKDKTLKQVLAKFAGVKTIAKINTEAIIDTVKIPFAVEVPCVFERDGAVLDKWYSLNYKANQNGISITNITIPDSIIIVSGFKKKWFLGAKTQTLDITHSNQLVQTKDIQHVEIKESKWFWQTDVFKIGLGVLGGILITK